MGTRHLLLSLALACAPALARVGPPDDGIQQVPMQPTPQEAPDLPDPTEVLEAPSDDANPPDAQQSAQRPDPQAPVSELNSTRVTAPRLKLDANFSSMEALPPPRHGSAQ